jgi:hypothetical protein
VVRHVECIYTPGVKAVPDRVIEYSVSVAVTWVPAADPVTAGELPLPMPPDVEFPLPQAAMSVAAPTAANTLANLRSNILIAHQLRVRSDGQPPICSLLTGSIVMSVRVARGGRIVLLGVVAWWPAGRCVAGSGGRR